MDINVKKLILLASCALMLIPSPTMAQESSDDFGVWTELGAEKNFGKHWSVGVDGEVRTEDNSSRIDRMNIGIGGGYKLNKYLKFWIGYQFMGYYTPEETSEHYKKNDDGSYKLDSDGNMIWNGRNVDAKHWTLKHRANVEVTGSFKPCSWLKLSLRERYQMTYAQETTFDETQYRYSKHKDSETGETVYDLKDGYPFVEQDTTSSKYSHLLRSRFKVEYDKKKCKWNPYVSAELHNNFAEGFHIDKVRTVIGCNYKINKHHTVGLGYVLTFELDDEKPTDRMHALSISYNYSF